MKSFLFLALVAFVVLLVLAQAFRNNFEAQLQQKVNMSIANSALVAPPGAKNSAVPSPGSNYQNFHGPTGQPHIVGPSGPPPNY